MTDDRLLSLDPDCWRVDNPPGIEGAVFAGPDVPVESTAVGDLLEKLEVQTTFGSKAELRCCSTFFVAD